MFAYVHFRSGYVRSYILSSASMWLNRNSEITTPISMIHVALLHICTWCHEIHKLSIGLSCLQNNPDTNLKPVHLPYARNLILNVITLYHWINGSLRGGRALAV